MKKKGSKPRNGITLEKAKTKLLICQKLADKHGWVCWYCGIPLEINTATIDHIIALGNGGDECLENYALCCIYCNRAKLDYPLEDFLAWIDFIRFSSRSRTYIESLESSEEGYLFAPLKEYRKIRYETRYSARKALSRIR